MKSFFKQIVFIFFICLCNNRFVIPEEPVGHDDTSIDTGEPGSDETGGKPDEQQEQEHGYGKGNTDNPKGSVSGAKRTDSSTNNPAHSDASVTIGTSTGTAGQGTNPDQSQEGLGGANTAKVQAQDANTAQNNLSGAFGAEMDQGAGKGKKSGNDDNTTTTGNAAPEETREQRIKRLADERKRQADITNAAAMDRDKKLAKQRFSKYIDREISNLPPFEKPLFQRLSDWFKSVFLHTGDIQNSEDSIKGVSSFNEFVKSSQDLNLTDEQKIDIFNKMANGFMNVHMPPKSLLGWPERMTAIKEAAKQLETILPEGQGLKATLNSGLSADQQISFSITSGRSAKSIKVTNITPNYNT